MSENNTLSEREVEVLALAATGLSNREIAQALTISPNTVKVHMSNIFEKTGAASRTEAAAYGMEHGIVDVPGGGEAAPGQPTWRELARNYYWVWIPILLLVVGALVVLSRAILFPPEPALADLAERWQELAPMPEPREAMAAGAYDGQIYTFAGEGPAGVSGSVFRYDPESDSWSQLSDKPTAVADIEAALIGEKFYIPGGRLENGQPTDILEIYDPRTDTWELGPLLPQAISAYALAGFEGRLYLFGGWDGEKALDAVYVYDPGVGTWRAGTAMTITRYDHGAVAMADKIVVLGGRNEDEALSDAASYLPSRDTAGEEPWETFKPLPTPRYGFGAASVFETIYVIGEAIEESDVVASKMGFVFNETSWEQLPLVLQMNRQHVQIISTGSVLYVFNPVDGVTKTETWAYQAVYFEIFIPFIQ